MHVLGANNVPVPALKEHEASSLSMKNKYLFQVLSCGKNNVSTIFGFHQVEVVVTDLQQTNAMYFSSPLLVLVTPGTHKSFHVLLQTYKNVRSEK